MFINPKHFEYLCCDLASEAGRGRFEVAKPTVSEANSRKTNSPSHTMGRSFALRLAWEMFLADLQLACVKSNSNVVPTVKLLEVAPSAQGGLSVCVPFSSPDLLFLFYACPKHKFV